jgi:hypothetical protein
MKIDSLTFLFCVIGGMLAGFISWYRQQGRRRVRQKLDVCFTKLQAYWSHRSGRAVV